MKIIHIAEHGVGGGAESVFRESIVLLKEFDPENSHAVACKRSTDVPFPIDYFFSPEISIISSIYSLNHKKEMKLFLDDFQPDVIHLHHIGLLSPSILHAISNFKKIKPSLLVVQTAHTFEYACSHYAAFDYKKSVRCLDCSKQRFKTKIFYRNCSRAGFLHSIGKGVSSWISHFFYRRKIIDIIIAPSNFMKDTIANTNLHPKQDIRVVSNPIAKQFIENPMTFEKENQIVYFGRLSDEKNIQLILKAYNHYQNECKYPFKLLIIGEGPEENNLKKLVNDLKLAELVRFLPFMQHSELRKHLSRSKIAVMASKCYENAPMMIIESLAFNIIPIVCNHGGMREMVDKFRFGVLFDSDSVHSLAYKISEITSKYNMVIKATMQVRVRAQNILAKDNYVGKLKEIYSQRVES